MPLQVSAITVVDGQSVPVENVEPGHVVTSLTLMPMVGLRYGATYTLSLSDAIVDRDVDANGVPTAQPLVPFTSGPEALGGSDDAPQAVGLVVLGDRAYLAETDYTGGTGATLQSGYLDTYDLTNPALPEPIPPPVRIGYPPRDIAGEMTGDLDAPQRTVVVATAPRTWFMLQGELIYSYEIKSSPSNLFVYDVSTEPAKWVGAVSLTANVNDGIPNRIVLKDGLVYAATQGKGIQVVDVARARDGFSPDGVVDYTTYAKVANGNLNTSAIVLTVPVTDPPGAAPGEPAVHLPVTDLKVMDLAVGGSPRRVVLATGPRRQIGLVVVDTLYGQTLWRGALVHPTGAVDVPGAIAVATLDDTPYALVGGVGTVNSVSTPVLAVVSLAPLVETGSAPVVVALLALPHAVGDILVTGQTAIVSGDRGSVDANGQPGVATLVDLTLPVQPRIVGSLSGVGSRLALTADNILLSTERAFVKGEGTPLGGVRSATFTQLAVIAAVRPEPITVSAGDEVFQNTSLEYKVIPAQPVSTSEVVIDVVGGSRVTTLPIVPAVDSGVVMWPKGTIVNTTRTYQARFQAEVDGRLIPSLPRRLRFEKVPLAVTTRDRLLRIQFALAEQGLFTNRKYGVRVYLTQPGGVFGSTPSFAVGSADIEASEPNRENWLNGLEPGSERSTAKWVTTKIDRMELPPGTDAAIRRQAFEIGTILNGYPSIRVVVVSEDTGQELAVMTGTITQDGDWSGILTRITTQLRAAAGEPVAEDPPLPPVEFDPQHLFSGWSGLAYRAVYGLLESQLSKELLSGLVEGFSDGWSGDKQTVAMLRDAALHPINTALAFGRFVKDFISGLSAVNLQDIARKMMQGGGGLTLPTLDDILWAAGQTAYYGGYLVGYLVEQVLVSVAVGVVTLGVGTVITKAAQLTRAGLWVANLTGRALAGLRSLGLWVERLAQLGAESRAARVALAVLRESGDFVEALWTKYPQASALVRRVAEASYRGGAAVGKTALKWLTVVDRMSDAGAARLVTFIERKGSGTAELWLGRWTDPNRFANGPTAVRQAFEAYDGTGDAAETLHDVLVTAAARTHSPIEPNRNVVSEFVGKYRATANGNQVESGLGSLRQSIDDARYTDEAIGETVRLHADPAVPVVGDEAVRGSASIGSVPCPLVASLVLAAAVARGGCGVDVLKDFIAEHPTLETRLNLSLKAFDVAGDPELQKVFVKIASEAKDIDADVVRAVFFAPSASRMSPHAAAVYFQAFDRMRDGNRELKKGLLAPANAGASANIKGVGNKGDGSIAEAYEIVATQRMIGRGLFGVDDVESFGEKISTSGIPGVTTSTIEADTWLHNGTMIDMKHSMSASPDVPLEQINNIKLVLNSQATRVQRVIYGVSGELPPATRQAITYANQSLRDSLGVT